MKRGEEKNFFPYVMVIVFQKDRDSTTFADNLKNWIIRGFERFANAALKYIEWFGFTVTRIKKKKKGKKKAKAELFDKLKNATDNVRYPFFFLSLSLFFFDSKRGKLHHFTYFHRNRCRGTRINFPVYQLNA